MARSREKAKKADRGFKWVGRGCGRRPLEVAKKIKKSAKTKSRQYERVRATPLKLRREVLKIARFSKTESA